jgi:hypothetical protein
MDYASTSTDTTPRAIRKANSTRAPSSLVSPSFSCIYFQAGAYEQHDVVVDYLTTHAYLETAKSLSDARPHPDQDGMDVEMGDESGSSLDANTLAGIEKRRSKLPLLCGSCAEGTDIRYHQSYPKWGDWESYRRARSSLSGSP